MTTLDEKIEQTQADMQRIQNIISQGEQQLQQLRYDWHRLQGRLLTLQELADTEENNSAADNTEV